jgi:cellulose synthase/poly-beta-1,6-N-acetylglucosamine synthase-like glycosyltransferase
MIDDFVAHCCGRCTVVRRGVLTGFKAGNLNHCISLLAGRYPFFAIVDQDTRLHPNTLDSALAYLNDDPDLAFVQFGVRHDSKTTTEFADDIGLTLDVCN